MTVLKGMPEASGEMLYALFNASPGDELVVCGTNKLDEIHPEGKKVDSLAETTAEGLSGILDRISTDPDSAVTVLSADSDAPKSMVTAELQRVLRRHRLDSDRLPWHYEAGGIDRGFSSFFQPREENTLFVITQDDRPLACARLILSETVENDGQLDDYPIYHDVFKRIMIDSGSTRSDADKMWVRIIRGARLYDKVKRLHAKDSSVDPKEQAKYDDLPAWQRRIFYGEDERDGLSYNALDYAYNEGLLYYLPGYTKRSDAVIGGLLAEVRAEIERARE